MTNATPPPRLPLQLLLLLAEHANEPKQATRLRHLASAGGKAEYTEYVQLQGRGVAELLDEFSSCTPPLGALLELVRLR